jgi:hypothetical protein
LVDTRLQKFTHYFWNCPGIWSKSLLSQPTWLYTPPICSWPPPGWTNLGGLYGKETPSFSFIGDRIQSL